MARKNARRGYRRHKGIQLRGIGLADLFRPARFLYKHQQEGEEWNPMSMHPIRAGEWSGPEQIRKAILKLPSPLVSCV